jgi:outer membrane protein assembly factor BamB
MPPDGPRSNRRRFLATLAAATLAGCTESGEPTPTDRSTDRPTATATDQSTATGTAPATEPSTETPDQGTPEPRPLDDSWGSFGYGAGNSGRNDGTQPLTGNDPVWGVKIAGDNTLPEPVVTPEAVHVTSESFLYGISRTDGLIEWRTDLGLPAFYFTPAVGDGVLYIPARSLTGVYRGTDAPGALLAVDAATGDVRWRREAYVTSSPLLAGGLLYHAAATASTGTVEAVALDGEETAWSYQFGDGDASTAFGTPALADGRLFATGNDGREDPTGRLVALDAATGKRQWGVTTEAATEDAPAVADGDVFFGTEAGTLYSVDAETGSTNWTHELPERVVNKPSVGGDLVYALADSKLHAVDRTDGTRRWSTPTDPVEDNVTVTTDHVFVGGENLEAFDAATGELVWDRPPGGYTGGYGVPVIVDGYLYAGVCVKETPESIYDNYVYQFG